jgi:hypothetical protein
LIFCLCLVLNAIALVWGLKAENLDAWKCGGWGVFIAPTTKMTVGGGCCRMAHRTVRCTTGHCPVRQPRHPVVGFLPLELLTAGPPDSPVHHRTLSGAPATSPGRWVLTIGASDSWATGQSGGAPDSHCSLSGAPSGACSDFCARRRAL